MTISFQEISDFFWKLYIDHAVGLTGTEVNNTIVFVCEVFKELLDVVKHYMSFLHLDVLFWSVHLQYGLVVVLQEVWGFVG